MSTTPCHRLDCTRPADIKHLIGRDMVLFCAHHWNAATPERRAQIEAEVASLQGKS